jgi:hypothetical protein
MKTLNSKMRLPCLMLLMFFFSVSVCRAEEPEDKNPLGCRDSGYQFTLRTLDLIPHNQEGMPSLFFIYNRTTQPIQLSQMLSLEDSSRTSINHTIPPRQWAVLAMDRKNVKYACSVPNKKSIYGQVTDCAQSLKICNFARVKYGLNNRGNFWMVSGTSKNAALREVTYYGVIAR